MLWLVMETVCPSLAHAHVALFSDNSPTVHWAQRLAAKHSKVAIQLVRALALRLHMAQASPLTPLHIAGADNSMTDIPSRSFGSEPKWLCNTDDDLLTLFNAKFPLPQQASWTVFQISSEIATRLTSILRMKPFTADDWRQRPKVGKNTGTNGSPMSHLWAWTLTYRTLPTHTVLEPSQDSQHEFGQDTMVDKSRYALEQSLALSRPLARRSLWPMEPTQPKSCTPTNSFHA
jgi:hypothetical protein